jgi:hypothetical protein
MTTSEQKMADCLRDAIAMLYWHQKKPLSAAGWASWLIDAHAALNGVQHAQGISVLADNCEL